MNSQEFRTLLAQRDFDAAQRALDEGFTLDQARDPRGRSLMHWALSRNDAAVAHWVLDRQPELTIESGEHTLLTLAHQMGDPSVAERLLKQGGAGQLDERDRAGLTPLMRVLQQRPRNEAACRALIREGADVNAQSSKAKDSVLMIALNEGHRGLIQELADRGADPNVPNAMGEVAAHVAAATTSAPILEVFLEAFPQADLDRPAHSGTPPIMRARSAAAVIAMIEAGADVNVRSANSYEECITLLMLLAQMPDSEPAVEMALEHGADLSPTDLKGCTAAGYAARRGRLDILGMFYDKGWAPASPLDREGISPYHAVLHRADPEQAAAAVQELVSRGVPVDVGCRPSDLPLDKRHPSPLFLALKQGLPDHAQMLLAAGARPDQAGPDGVPALHALSPWVHQLAAAKLANDLKMVAIDRVPGADADTRAASKRRLEAEKQEGDQAFEITWAAIQATHPNWNAVDSKGRTCLDSVAQTNQAEWGLRLLQAGVSPTLAGEDGFTAMDRAVFCGSARALHAWQGWMAAAGVEWSPDVGELVLNSPDDGQERQQFLRGLEALSRMPDWSAWVNRADDQGNPPLILATATGQADVVRFLLTHGADATQANAAGETALHHAVLTYASETIGHLRAAGASEDQADSLGRTPRSLGGSNSQVATSLDRPPIAAVWTEGESLDEQVADGQALVKALGAQGSTPGRRRRLQG